MIKIINYNKNIKKCYLVINYISIYFYLNDIGLAFIP